MCKNAKIRRKKSPERQEERKVSSYWNKSCLIKVVWSIVKISTQRKIQIQIQDTLFRQILIPSEKPVYAPIYYIFEIPSDENSFKKFFANSL